jgi:hypothetical protein
VPAAASYISVPFPSPKVWRNPAAVAVALGVSLLIAPAFADKPTSMLARVEPVTITAIPIDFDRDNPEHKQFRKLVWRSGLNLFANSSNFGGYSALAVDASRSLTATPRKAPPTSLSSATIASCATPSHATASGHLTARSPSLPRPNAWTQIAASRR